MSGKRWDLLSDEQKVTVVAGLLDIGKASTLDEIGAELEAAMALLDAFVPVRSICDTVGHIVTGTSTGTDPDSTVWGNYCQRCGAYVPAPALSGSVAPTEEQT